MRIIDAKEIIGIFERLLELVFAWFESIIAIAIILGDKIFVRINDFIDDNLRNK